MKAKIMEVTKSLSNKQLKEIIKEAIEEAKAVEKATLTIEECCKYSGIGRDKLLQLAHAKNDFPAFKVGKKFLVNKELLDEWLDKVSKEKISI
ncbi:excisionase [Clostridium rectalis]|uniref:excisionase n=1 Tax=Clostridium rectalis TaxID=2040295 RepID=UPI000F6344BE|nr:excisionase [Clostridium rectalis]